MQLSQNRIQFQGEQVLKVHDRKRSRTLHRYRLFLSVLGFKQPVEYNRSFNRAFYEAMSLLDYDYFGFDAPKLIWFKDNTLCMSKLSGDALDSTVLTDHVNKQLFLEINDRHFVARRENAPRLIHLDSNLSNIFISEDGISRLDFEMGRPYEPITELCAREISKTFVSLLKSNSSLDLSASISKFCDIYFDMPLLRKWALEVLKKHSRRGTPLDLIATEFIRCLGEQ